MQKHWKRFMSVLLSLVMLLALAPVQASAAEGGTVSGRTNAFRDVKDGAWFADAVEYVYRRDIFKGSSETAFLPNNTMDRAMLVTVLGRIARVDTEDYAQRVDFSDVSADSYYAPYVAWAVDNGITLGVGNDRFAPEQPVTRAQIAAFIARYLNKLGLLAATEGEETLPVDYDSVPEYAQSAVTSLWQMGLFIGDPGGYFAPQRGATRAEVAQLCMRLDRYLVAQGVKDDDTSDDAPDSTPDATPDAVPDDTPDDSSDDSTAKEYKIKLHMPDGSVSTLTQNNSALSLDNLPTLSEPGQYFLGWYYDEQYSHQALDGDTLSAQTTLYPKLLAAGEMETSDTPYYVVSTDVSEDFTVMVNSTSGADLTDKIRIYGPEQTPATGGDIDTGVILSVKKDGSRYILSGPDGKLVTGGTYQIVLEDDALSFAGVEQASVREYHFTVKQGEPVMNLHLKDSVKEISIQEIGLGAQIAAQNLSPVTVQAGQSGGVTTNNGLNEETGTFTYDGALNVGDTLAIYEGGKPSERTATTSDLGDVSYVTITGKNGNEYTYTAATTEEVLFVPDVLPIQNGWDTDTTDGSVLTITATNLTTAMDEVSAESLDEGDFLAFYVGASMEEATSVAYGCVTGFTESGGSYVISYADATENDVLTSMDISTKSNVSGEDILDGTDIEQMEENIAQQAIDSGFAQTVADNFAIAVMAMDLSAVEDGELDVSDIDLSELENQDLSFGTLDAAPLSTYAGAGGGGGGAGPEVEIESVRAQISTKLDHFTGKEGVRIALEMKISIEFDAGEEGESITIELTPTFVQELKLDISTKGGPKIKWKWIFPYIYDFYASVSVDMYTYTSINLNATISSGGEEDTPSKVKDMIEKVGGVVKDLSAMVKGENIEVTQGISELQDLYCDMLENDTEWITLYRKSITELSWNVALVIKIALNIDFVVQANVNISLGLEFDYENAKRYQYSVYVFHGKATSNTISLIPESYNLQLYAMGVLGIRAGVEVSLSVALITKEVAAVGVVVNVGAYLKVYGYVVYELHHVAGKPNTSSGSGALYIEVGCYLDVGMDLTAFGGKLSWKPTLYANEWPLWTAGSSLAVSGFAAAPDEDDEDAEVPTVYMKRGQTTMGIPAELLTMAGFDMRTGADSSVAYSYDWFDISFSDSRFSLTEDGQITLDFGDGYTWDTYPEREIQCDMTITWKGAPLSFNTETLQLKAKMQWDTYNDFYNLVYEDVLGTFADEQMTQKITNAQVRPTATLSVPTDPVRLGYIFKGWKVELVNIDGSLTELEEIPATMPEYDLRLTAQWEPRTDIQYTVIPMLQQPDGTYLADESESYTKNAGRVDRPFTLTLDDVDGYMTPDIYNWRIEADGSSVIKVNYPRQRYSFVRYLYEGGSFLSGSYLYGDTIDWTAPVRDGYTFAGWTVTTEDGTPLDTLPLTMPKYGLIMTANWTRNDDTPYTVYTYTQNEDGSYTLKDTLTFTGTTETVAKANVADEATVGDTTFTLPTYDGYTLRENSKNITITIKGSGAGYANYYYDLNRFQLVIYHKSTNGKVNETETKNGVGTTLSASTKTFAGYTLDGYYTDENCTAENKVDYPNALTDNMTLYAKWTANSNTKYTVEHYYEQLDGTYPETADETEEKTGMTGAQVQVGSKPKAGYQTPTDRFITIEGDGSTLVQFTYTRKTYTLTLEMNGAAAADPTQVKYGAPVAPETPSRTGWTFDGWYTDSLHITPLADDATMPAENWTLYAKWTANEGIAYTVEHYQQNAAGEDYTLADTDLLTGTSGAQTTATARTYNGFTAQTISQTTISGDGTTVVKIYYDRDCFTLTYDLNAGDDTTATLDNDASATARYRHGATVSDQPTASRRAGYTFAGWYTDANGTTAFDGTMPMQHTTLYAKWEVGNVSYTVKHYLQALDGSYPSDPEDTVVGSGNVDATVAPTFKTYAGFTAPETQTTITLSATAADNVVSYYYTRNQYSLSYSGLDDVTFPEETDTPTGSQLKYGASVTAPDMNNATRTGYCFDGWYTDSSRTTPLADDATMPAYALTLYAKWTPITYTLRFNSLGNVPLKTWLLAQTGAVETQITPDEGGNYENNGIPYIDIPVTYDETFTLPSTSTAVTIGGENYVLANCGVTGFTYGGGWNSETSQYEQPTEVALGGSIHNITDTDGDIVNVEVQWPSIYLATGESSTVDDPAKIYNVSQLWEVLAGSSNSYYPYSMLMVDLEVNNQTANGSLGNGGASGWFDGNNHTIKALKISGYMSGYMGVLDGKRAENFTVKNVTLEGFTVTYAHSTEEGFTNDHGYYGGLFGEVGDNFTLENVTIKNLTMNLTLNGEINEFSTLDRDCVGGLIGYAAGTVTLTNCTVTGTTMNVILLENSDAAIGSLIGYVNGPATNVIIDDDCSIDGVDGYATIGDWNDTTDEGTQSTALMASAAFLPVYDITEAEEPSESASEPVDNEPITEPEDSADKSDDDAEPEEEPNTDTPEETAEETDNTVPEESPADSDDDVEPGEEPNTDTPEETAKETDNDTVPEESPEETDTDAPAESDEEPTAGTPEESSTDDGEDPAPETEEDEPIIPEPESPVPEDEITPENSLAA